MTAMRRDVDGDVRMCRSSVVFPEPRNPDSKVTGIGDLVLLWLSGAAISLVDRSEMATGILKLVSLPSI